MENLPPFSRGAEARRRWKVTPFSRNKCLPLGYAVTCVLRNNIFFAVSCVAFGTGRDDREFLFCDTIEFQNTPRSHSAHRDNAVAANC